MRILLVAYDFPPTQSPRALRWRYLVRELALLGHEVHVLVPDLGAPGVDFPASPGQVVVHRGFPGPCGWLVRRANDKRSAAPAEEHAAAAAKPLPTGLNWRGQAVDLAKRAAGLVMFPDIRVEWNPWARQVLRRLVAEVAPDVVVTSHEPASTLLLGLYARRFDVPWVADLGDPVCAAYTPPRWRRRALALEARVCAHADAVLVTNEATRSLLEERHGDMSGRCAVLPNGYDDRRPRDAGAGAGVAFDGARLELVYAGRLYGYRDPTPLLAAVAGSPGVRLTLVVPDPPSGSSAEAVATAAGGNLRVMGQMPHAQVQGLLGQADVLVNLGDREQPVRTPAKLFEYLGIPRPILHVHSEGADAAADLLARVRRGWQCADDADALATLLGRLRERKRAGRLHEGLELAPVAEYAHSSLGRRLGSLLAAAVSGRHGRAG